MRGGQATLSKAVQSPLYAAGITPIENLRWL